MPTVCLTNNLALETWAASAARRDSSRPRRSANTGRSDPVSDLAYLEKPGRFDELGRRNDDNKYIGRGDKRQQAIVIAVQYICYRHYAAPICQTYAVFRFGPNLIIANGSVRPIVLTNRRPAAGPRSGPK